MRLNFYDDWREPDDFEEDSCWELVDRKSVPDSDGFYTDYCLYYNVCEDYYVTVFGDCDLYGPEQGYFDAEFDNEAEALEWFENYGGFEDDDIYSSTNVKGNKSMKKYIRSEYVLDPEKEKFYREYPSKPSDEYMDFQNGLFYWYFTKHGVGPGSVPRGLNIIDIIDTPQGSYFLTDRVLTTKSLNFYDIKEKSPEDM